MKLSIKSVLKKVVLPTALFFITIFAVSAQQLTDIRTPSTRASAMGGRHTALADDLDTLFNNPAGFQQVDSELSVAEITLGLSGPIFDIAGVVVEAAGGGASGGATAILTSPNVQNLMKGLYASVNLLGPISFGYVGRGLGLGLFNTSTVTISNSKPLTLTAYLSERLTLAGGYSFAIPFPEDSKHAFSIGLLLKGLVEGQLEMEKSFLAFPAMFESFSIETLTAEPFHFITAIGFDAGILYSYDDVIHFGLAGIDAFSPAMISSYSSMAAFLDGSDEPTITNSLFPAKINFGFMFSPKLGAAGRFISGLKLMLDYDDIFDFLIHPETARHPILHIGIGAELELLEILAIRVGMYEGLFNAGVGLDLKVLTLNASMFGTELSTEPGRRPVYNIMLGLEFRFDQPDRE